MLSHINPRYNNNKHVGALRTVLSEFLECAPDESGNVDIVTAETVTDDFETGIKLHSTDGLVFSVVPIIHRVCLFVNRSWFVDDLVESKQDLNLHIEYLPEYMGTVDQIQSGWTLPLAMKLLYGYFNDMQQMNEQFGHHY